MLKRLEKPVHITFFHDPLMRETVELYELMASQTDKLTLELYDPMLNPAQARLRGVQFAGTAIMESEGRKLQVNGPSETEIANGILRVSLGVTQKVCFLDGHREADPFSTESHDHMEGTAGHTHGLGTVYLLHEQHGMGKARNALGNSELQRREDIAYAQRRRRGASELRASGRGGPQTGAATDGGRGDPGVSGGGRQRVLPARSLRAHRARIHPAGIRNQPRRRYRDRRGQPFLGRSVLARRHRLQLSSGDPRTAADIFPRRPIAFANVVASSWNQCHPAGQFVEAKFRRDRSAARAIRQRQGLARTGHADGDRHATSDECRQRSALPGGSGKNSGFRDRRREESGAVRFLSPAALASPWSGIRISPPIRSSTSWATASCS